MSKLPSGPTIQVLKQELEQLKQEQIESLRWASFVGMTAEEVRVHDERRARIRELTQQLAELQQSGQA